jgi:hypothetical protein
MIRANKPRIQYNPVFRDSSSNSPFEDIFLYDNKQVYSREKDTEIIETEIKTEDGASGCFYSFNKIISNIIEYFKCTI